MLLEVRDHTLPRRNYVLHASFLLSGVLVRFDARRPITGVFSGKVGKRLDICAGLINGAVPVEGASDPIWLGRSQISVMTGLGQRMWSGWDAETRGKPSLFWHRARGRESSGRAERSGRSRAGDLHSLFTVHRIMWDANQEHRHSVCQQDGVNGQILPTVWVSHTSQAHAAELLPRYSRTSECQCLSWSRFLFELRNTIPAARSPTMAVETPPPR